MLPWLLIPDIDLPCSIVHSPLCLITKVRRIDSLPIVIYRGVWQGVAMDFLKFYPDPPCPTLLRLAGGPHLKRPDGRFRGGLRPSSTRLNTLRRTPMVIYQPPRFLLFFLLVSLPFTFLFMSGFSEFFPNFFIH
jgi:hypothetical protein